MWVANGMDVGVSGHAENDASFLKLMDGFGRAHAGRSASVGAFRERAESVAQ